MDLMSVDSILRVGTYQGTFFKVRWLGYTEADDTWEPESSLT